MIVPMAVQLGLHSTQTFPRGVSCPPLPSLPGSSSSQLESATHQRSPRILRLETRILPQALIPKTAPRRQSGHPA